MMSSCILYNNNIIMASVISYVGLEGSTTRCALSCSVSSGSGDYRSYRLTEANNKFCKSTVINTEC